MGIFGISQNQLDASHEALTENMAREQMASQAQFHAVKPNEVVDFLLTPHALPTLSHLSDLIADKALIRVMAFFMKMMKHVKIDMSGLVVQTTKEGALKGIGGSASFVIPDDEFMKDITEAVKTQIQADLGQVIDARALEAERSGRQQFFSDYNLDESRAHQIAQAPTPQRYDPTAYPPPQQYSQQQYPPQQYPSQTPPRGGGGGSFIGNLLAGL